MNEMNEEIMRKVQEQGRMTSEEHKKLFQKTDLTKESREQIDAAQRELKGRLDRESRKVYRRLEEVKQKIVPLEQVKVNPELAKKIGERTEARIREEIKKGTIPRYDSRKDYQMRRWLKR